MTQGWSDQTNKDPAKWWQFWKRRRHVIALLAFFGFYNIYALRVNLSVAIVAMTSGSGKNATTNKTNEAGGEFDWDSPTRGLVLSSFFYGYLCTQLLGGVLAARIGGARLFVAGVGFTAAATVVSPFVAKTSVYFFIALRIIEGLFEGITYPCIQVVWSKWAPPAERSSMASFSFSGCHLGTVVTLPLSGYIANTIGWPSIFYVTGSIGLLWCIAWILIVYENPEDDPNISQEELDYLKTSLKITSTKTKIIHPWKHIFTSRPFWVAVMAHFAENWGFYTLLTQLPTFMKDIMDYDLSKAGFLSSVPYLMMAIVMQFAGKLADWLSNNNILSVTNVRKLFNCSAFISQAVFMTLAGYLLSPTGVILCLVFAVGLGAFSWPAFTVNHLDLAPAHASVLFGISNTFATLPGILSPQITGFIVRNKTEDEWRVIFYLASSIYAVGCIFYALFGSGEEQPWARFGTDLDDSNKIPSGRNSATTKSIEDSISSVYTNKAFTSSEP